MKEIKQIQCGIEYEVKIQYNITNREVFREVKIYTENVEIGYFTIIGYPFHLTYDAVYKGVPNTMEIFIDRIYQKKGFAKIMIMEMIKKIIKMEPDIRKNQLLYIDTDISDGFWIYAGMKYIPNDLPQTMEGGDCDKYITFDDLQDFAFA